MNKNLKKLIAMAISITSVISVMTGASVSADTAASAGSGSNISYTGEAITPDIVLYDDDIQLVKGTDYDLAYENNINIGTATIIVIFKGNYTGERRINFNIIAKALGQDDVDISIIETQTYTGEPITPKPTVAFGDKTLAEGTDYDFEYENNTDAGTATVNVVFKGNYSGSSSASFVIEAKALTKDDVAITDIPEQEYTGGAIEPKPEIKYGDKTLVEGADYDITYENNTDVGTGTATITFKNNYSGEVSVEFTITSKPVTRDDVIFSEIESQTYTGSAIMPEPSITVDGVTLMKDKDYTLSYENNINIGTAMINVTFIGNYSGSASTAFTIEPMTVTEDNITISTIPDQIYTGLEITPDVTVTVVK